MQRRIIFQLKLIIHKPVMYTYMIQNFSFFIYIDIVSILCILFWYYENRAVCYSWQLPWVSRFVIWHWKTMVWHWKIKILIPVYDKKCSLVFFITYEYGKGRNPYLAVNSSVTPPSLWCITKCVTARNWMSSSEVWFVELVIFFIDNCQKIGVRLLNRNLLVKHYFVDGDL